MFGLCVDSGMLCRHMPCVRTHTHTHTTFVSRSEEFWVKGTVTQFASARKMLPRGWGRLVTQLLTTHPSLPSLVPSTQVVWTPVEGPQAAGKHSAEVPGLLNDL